MSRTRLGKHEETMMEVLRLKAVGGSIPSISRDLKISTRQVRKSLDHISMEVKEGLLSSFLADRLPLNIACHLELHRVIIAKAMAISEGSQDPRVKIEGLRLAGQIAGESAKILSDANLIGQAIRESAIVIHDAHSNDVTLSESPQS